MRNDLPTFNSCPGLSYFRHWIPDDGLINAVDSAIHYNLEPNEHGSLALKRRYSIVLSGTQDAGVKIQIILCLMRRAVYRKCSHSGAGSLFDAGGEWMKHGNILPSPRNMTDDTGSCLGFSPDADFTWFKHFGFENECYAEQALEQFSFIRECAWARDGSIDPRTLVATTARSKRRAEYQESKSRIFAQEKERCLREFEAEVKRQLSSGKMRCPKNVDMLFRSMLLNGHVAETNPGSLEFKEQWDALREKMICDRDARIKMREGDILL